MKAGGKATLKIKRLNLAQRLYRITGAGIYRDTLLIGEKPPIREPLLNGLVFGSDSVVNAVYRGKIYWFWGDTNRPALSAWKFSRPRRHVRTLPDTADSTRRRESISTILSDDKGFARPTAQMPGEGPTWIDGLVVLREDDGRERMFAAYVKVKPPLDVYQRGLAEFDDESGSFKKVTEFDNDAPAYPGGHPFVMRDGDIDYVYFCRPLSARSGSRRVPRTWRNSTNTRRTRA